MKLSDIMGHAGLSIWTEIALVLFLFAFLLVVVRLFAPAEQATLRGAGSLPLDDPNDRLARPRPAGGAPGRPE